MIGAMDLYERRMAARAALLDELGHDITRDELLDRLAAVERERDMWQKRAYSAQQKFMAADMALTAARDAAIGGVSND